MNTCPICGSPVTLHHADEGTSYMVSDPTEAYAALRELHRLGNRLSFLLDHTPAIPRNTTMPVSMRDVQEAQRAWLGATTDRGRPLAGEGRDG